MSRQCLPVLALLLLVSSFPGARRVGQAVAGESPVAQVKALLKEKKFAEAETLLAPLLAKRAPSAAVLRAAFDLACAQGKLIKAQQVVKDLLTRTDAKDLPLLYQAAQVAEATGETRLALARYLAYVRAGKTASPEAAHAYAFLLQRGAYPEELQACAKRFGAQPLCWELGYRMFRQLLESDEAEAALALARFLMTTFPESGPVSKVQRALREGAEKGMLGRDASERFVAPLRLVVQHGTEDLYPLDWLFGRADAHLPPEEKVALLFAAQQSFGKPLGWGVVHRFGHLRNLPTDAAKLEAGKKYLALDALYRQDEDPSRYREYLRIIVESPQVFLIKDKALVTPAAMQEKFDHLLGRLSGRADEATHEIRSLERQGFLGKQREPWLRQHQGVLAADLIHDLLSLTPAKDRPARLAAALKGRGVKAQLDIEYYALEWHHRDKRPDAALALAKKYMLTYPGSFNWGHIWHHFVHNGEIPLAVRLAALTEVLQKGGRSAPLAEIVKRLTKDKNWKDQEAFKAFMAEWDKNPAGSDPVCRAHVELYRLPRKQHKPAAAVLDAVKRALGAVEGSVCGGWEVAKTPRDLTLTSIFHKHWDHIWNNRDAVYEAARIWSTRLGFGSSWEPLLRRTHEHRGTPVLYEIAPRYLALCKEDVKVPGWAWYRLRHAAPPAKVKGDLFAGYYHRMGAHGLEWLRHQDNRLGAKKVLAELEALVKRPDFQMPDAGQARALIHHAYHRASGERKPLILVEKAWQYLAEHGGSDTTTEAYAFGTYMRAGESKQALAWLKVYQARLDKRPVHERLEALQSFLGQMPREEKEELQPGHRGHATLELLAPLVREATGLKRPGFYHQHLLEDLAWLMGWKQAAVANRAAEAAAVVVEGLAAGVRFEGWSGGPLWSVSARPARAARDSADWLRLGRIGRMLVTQLAERNDRHGLYRARLLPFCRELADGGASEMAFLWTEAMLEKGKPDAETAKLLAMAKADFARTLEIIGVAANHPAYNLHKAQHELALGHEEEAWKLAKTKLDLLPKEWINLDPRFGAWAAEQMRRQKLLKEGLNFCFTMLLQEQRLEPEVAAAISLIKGDIYTDMQNYDAARAEFEGLRNDRRVNRTEAGQKAQYRLIDLMIQIGNFEGAEQAITILLDEADDLNVQAEGWFYRAKSAFMQKEYALCHEHLMQCFSRNTSHVEGRMLEGRLRPLVPGLLRQQIVKVGRLTDKEVVVPGHEMTIQLQDQNLAVVKANKAIPVTVTTEPGGDRERVELHPSAGEKNVFSGTIATQLGPVEPGNFSLEVTGQDRIAYVIEESFQKDNDLAYAPKYMAVRANGRLMASAGEILSPEEEEKREMERQLMALSQNEQSRRFAGRDGKTVRPGSPVYVQVVDPDRDLGDEPDTVAVSLATTSGDRVEDFALTETEAHSGIFRGAVPTSIPFPKAVASDTEEGGDPMVVINAKKEGAWSSLPDGKAPKWIEVDTMSSHAVREVVLTLPEAAALRRVELRGQLADDYETLAVWPAADGAAKGGATVEVAGNQAGHRAWEIRRHVARLGGAAQRVPEPIWDRSATPHGKRDGWLCARVRSAFWLPESRTLELRFLQKPSPHNWQHAYVLIDGEEVLGGRLNRQSIKMTHSVHLPAGGHHLEILVRDHWRASAVRLGYRDDDGTFVPLPAAWFDVEAQPDLAAFLRPKGSIEVNENRLVATLAEPVRLRKLRWVFKEFTSNAVTVEALRVVNAAGEAVVPVETDFAEATQNQILEIAAGDHIKVTYADDRRLARAPPELSDMLNSSYHNASVLLAHEEIQMEEERRTIDYHAARRCRIGDQLSVMVVDYDEDLTDERDTVAVRVTTSAGEALTIKLLETHQHNDERWHRHAGTFLEVLRIGEKTGGNTIAVKPGDVITATYLDRENTKPGIPIERTYTVGEAGLGEPRIASFTTTTRLVADNSTEARAKLERMRARGRDVEGVTIQREQVVAVHPQYERDPKQLDLGVVRPPAEGEPYVSVNAPILFEIQYPRMALNAGSVYTITAVAQSELDAAKAAGREPNLTEVPLVLRDLGWLARSKGYNPYILHPLRRSEDDILREGVFAGLLRLQIGAPGDPVNDLVELEKLEFVPLSQRQRGSEANRVPTLVVAGADVVELRAPDETGAVVKTHRLRLLSDARLELMDRSYTVAKPAIHLGDWFYVRLVDPDQDKSDERDRVTVTVASALGDEVALTLSETLPHSGTFTGSLQPSFYEEAAPQEKAPAAAAPAAKQPAAATPIQPAAPALDKTDQTLQVRFGDEVTFTFSDRAALSRSESRDITMTGRIHLGFDGKQAGFTKRFSDPEMAVKTRFLMAEALFEMAKEHRKLGKKEVADEEIGRGKRILEEALRDYPDTTLVSQGEFLLANLAQELGKYTEAIARYRTVISSWPDSDFAPRSQYKMAICLQKMENHDQACEEFVRLTYIHPNHPLVAEATVRLGNHYYKTKDYGIAGRIFFQFQQKNPEHKIASRALFLSAQCEMKLERYDEAIRRLEELIETYKEESEVRAEAMYWLGDCCTKTRNYVKAYRTFKKLTWDYPETKWAKIARGRLTEDVFARIEE